MLKCPVRRRPEQGRRRRDPRQVERQHVQHLIHAVDIVERRFFGKAQVVGLGERRRFRVVDVIGEARHLGNAGGDGRRETLAAGDQFVTAVAPAHEQRLHDAVDRDRLRERLGAGRQRRVDRVDLSRRD